MLPEIKINNNKGPMTGLDKVGYYSWLLKSYLDLPDKECDNKLTKYNVELMRICNEYNEFKNNFLVKAHLVKEILQNGTNEGEYPYIIVNNIIKIMVSVKKQSSLMKALKFKLKKQGVNKEWFKVLKFNTDRITNRLIELDNKSLDTAVEMTEVGVFFRILRNQGIDPIEHIKNNVYIIEQEDYNNPEENKKQQESIKVYIDNMHKIINEDVTLNNKDIIIQETQQNLDRYVQYRNEVKNKIEQHKQEYEAKANQDFIEVCKVKLDNYCIRFKKGIKDDNYDNLVIANKLLDRIVRLAQNNKDIRIVAGKYIVVLIRTRGKNVFDIRFVSRLTKINLDIKPEKTWLKTTHSVEDIRILDEDEAKYIIENLNETRDKCIGKEIRLDEVYKSDVLKNKIGYTKINNESTVKKYRYEHFLEIYNKSLDNDATQLNNCDLDDIKDTIEIMMEMIDNYTTRVCSEYSNHSMQIFSLDKIGVSIVGFKRSKAKRTIKIKLRLSKESEASKKDIYKWVTYDNLYDYLRNNVAIYRVKGSIKSSGFYNILYNNVLKELNKK